MHFDCSRFQTKLSTYLPCAECIRFRFGAGLKGSQRLTRITHYDWQVAASQMANFIGSMIRLCEGYSVWTKRPTVVRKRFQKGMTPPVIVTLAFEVDWTAKHGNFSIHDFVDSPSSKFQAPFLQEPMVQITHLYCI